MARLVVITGPMFSGKSEELIRLLRRQDIAKKRILVVKPTVDTRTGNCIASRRKGKSGKFENSEEFPATPIGSREELEHLFFKVETDVLALDEAQFFGPWIVDFVQGLIEKKSVHKIIVAGLDMDAWGKPFGPMPELLAMADEVKKETAVCFRCGREEVPAVITQKLAKGSGEQVEVGNADLYGACCRDCWTTPPKE